MSHPRQHSNPILERSAHLIRELAPSLPRSGRFLEVGAGVDPPLRSLFPSGIEFVDATIERGSGLVRCSADALALRRASCDGYVSFSVLEHVEDPDRALAEARRVVRPGGVAIVSTHGVYPFHAFPLDRHRWTMDGLTTLIGKHFEIEAAYPIGGLALVISTLLAYWCEHVAPIHAPRSAPVLRRCVPAINAAGRVLDPRLPSQYFGGREHTGAVSVSYLVLGRRRA